MITIEEVKRKNREIGHHWFDEDTMRFFSSKIETRELIGDKFFISSEQFVPSTGRPGPRKFSIREFEKTGEINTIGEFQQFKTKDNAIKVAKCMAEGKTLETCIAEIGVK